MDILHVSKLPLGMRVQACIEILNLHCASISGNANVGFRCSTYSYLVGPMENSLLVAKNIHLLVKAILDFYIRLCLLAANGRLQPMDMVKKI